MAANVGHNGTGRVAEPVGAHEEWSTDGGPLVAQYSCRLCLVCTRIRWPGLNLKKNFLGRMVDALCKIALGTLLRGNRTKSWIFYRHRFIFYRHMSRTSKACAASMCGYIELATALTGSFLWILRTRGYHVWIHGTNHSP